MPITDKALKLSRLKLRSDQLVEIHLDKMPEPPDQMMRLPGVAAWFGQMRLKEERDQQALHRMLTQISSAITTATTTETVTTPSVPALTIQQILTQILPTLLGLFIKKAESDTITGPLYTFGISGANMRWKNGQLQIKSENANSSGQQLWHTLRAVYVDDTITPYLDPSGEA